MSLLNLRKSKTKETKATVQPETTETTSKKVVAKATSTSVKPIQQGGLVNSVVLLRPHISERASEASAHGMYVFKVALSATKPQIKAAVTSLYNVTVRYIRTVTVHPKKITVKGTPGMRKRSRKAYVFLKKGDKIEIM